MEDPEILTIEWEMMDKSRFFMFSIINSFTLRCLVYPLTVIKTRLQVQKQGKLYSGTFDACSKILRYEGFVGLYRGFWINTIQMFSGIGYIFTYEKVRDVLSRHADIHDRRLKGLIAGGCSSLVSQTIITPFDVVSQHIMVLGRSSKSGGMVMNPLNISADLKRKHLISAAIVRELYRRDGFSGFYRGYFASLLAYVPGSALWWMFYPAYADGLRRVLPGWTPQMFVQCMAGPMSGITVCFITNPMDVVRARIQVQRMNSVTETFWQLWTEERMRMFQIGLSARVMQSVISSFLLALGYETLKRWSVHDEYKDKIRW
ncbi:solute carrier family 25 member 44 [Dermacentor variabilis]|uniref:solute carrier family 25 member 44 n=1 Tax=Dermacentor variabilis TaxID=34621 RepID=UPI003F5C16E7